MELIDHLMDIHGKTTPIDIMDNKYWMEESTDTYQPIDVYFKRIDNSVQFGAYEKTPYKTDQILQMVYHATLANLCLCLLSLVPVTAPR